ncbi:MAG: BufA2 family periplasmic bufferin-type metallophore [Gammaproteobacteria bacterium]
MISAKGLMLATAAAALFASGAGVTEEAPAPGSDGKVRCKYVNRCGGKSECKTATNKCKRQNACAGQGMSWLTRTECEAIGGAVIPEVSRLKLMRRFSDE